MISDNRLRCIIVALLLILGVCCDAMANIGTCDSRGYTVCFFNGVWNTSSQAYAGMKALKRMIGTSYNNEPIYYITLYNQTGSQSGGTSLTDIAEVFQQKSAELDSSGELGKRWEFFWETVKGHKPMIGKFISSFSSFTELILQLDTFISTKLIDWSTTFLSNPPTELDYAIHNSIMDALEEQKQKVMLIGHSQGNLFLNHAYDHATHLSYSRRMMAAHLAPASSTLRGGYLLADIDVVIKGLRTLGVLAVPNFNLILPFSKADPSGHTLLGTYLDPSRPGKAAVAALISDEMRQLPNYGCPPPPE